MTIPIDSQLIWLFAQTASQVVLSPDGDPDMPLARVRHSATEAGLAAVMPIIVDRVRRQIAAEIETVGPGDLRSRSWWAEWVRSGGASATVLPSAAFDELAAGLDEPAVPNEATRDAFRRLGETVERRD